MGFSLYTLFQAGLLCLNAICVLNEERFLSKIGWSTQHGGFGEDPGMKIQALNLIRAVQTVMKVPLIALNIMTIVMELLFG